MSRWGSGHPGGLRSLICAASLQPGFESRSGRIFSCNMLKVVLISQMSNAGKNALEDESKMQDLAIILDELTVLLSRRFLYL